jgi:hypothetical protein
MDNFDLKKFLKESKALENLNPSIKAVNEGMSREDMKAKIKEMIVAELDNTGIEEETAVDMMDPVYEGDDEDYELEDRKVKYGINPEKDDEDYSDYFFDINTPEDDLEEAKKKKDEEVEDIDVTDTEDISTEDLPTDEEAPAEDLPTGNGLEDLAADMKGTEADLMDHLMKAFQIAKGMGNEKLETQVGNTLKFFVSEYIGGGED